MMEGPVVGSAAGRPLGVLDLHAHPSMKTYMFRRRFWKAHNPPGFMFPPTLRTDFDALVAGNCQVICCSVYVVERGWIDDVWPIKIGRALLPRLRHILSSPPDTMTHEYLDHLESVLDETRQRRGNAIALARSYDDMVRIQAEGKIAVVNTIEGAHHLNGNLDNVEAFAQRGVASMIVPHMYPNEAGGCSNAIPEDILLRKLGCFRQTFDPTIGLTDWGYALIERMFDVGMVVDMSHGTPQFRKDVLAHAQAYSVKRPVIMSHVGVAEYCPCDMNPTPEDIRGIAETGGVVGVIFMGTWLNKPRLKSGREILVKTIQHIIDHGGEDAAAIGTDFDGFTDPPPDFKSPRDFVALRALLEDHFTAAQVDKILHGNADRVLRLGWGSMN